MPTSSSHGPSPEHEERREHLDTLAFMAGYTKEIPTPLLKGLRPDVVKQTAERDAVFIGDAKHSERPSNTATIDRLGKYVRWLSGLSAATKRRSIFALCYGNRLETADWQFQVSKIARTNHLDGHVVRHINLGADTHVICLCPARREKNILSGYRVDSHPHGSCGP